MSAIQEFFQETKVQAFRRALLSEQQKGLWSRYEKLNKTVSHPNVVFAGDSITEFYPIHELLSSKFKLYNRGIHGITSLQLRAHLHNQIIDLIPDKLFLLIGINDLKTHSPYETFLSIDMIIKDIIKECPQTHIYLLSILPINTTSDFIHSSNKRSNQAIIELNNYLTTLKDVDWIDIHQKLCDESGQLYKPLTTDGIHLTIEGYELISEELRKHLLV